jgi:hypothetical protein
MRSWPGLDEKLPGKVSEFEVLEWASRHNATNGPTGHNAAIDSLRAIFEIARERGIIGTKRQR